uniref:DNA-directed RNA polymerase n=1 Tax=viral metagenome TaxID=1070528 RepID=A0A6C0J5I7_9ZZZZ
MSNKITQKDLNLLIKLYFKQPHILYTHLFSSYHQLLEEIIPNNICNDYNYFYESIDKSKIYLHGLKCENVRIKPPTLSNTNELLSPKEARKKHLKYFGTLLCDITQIVEEKDIISGNTIIREVGEKANNVAIGSIPIMIKSKYCTTTIKKELLGECKYDPGGYFINNGQEKVIMSIEKMVDNKILVFPKKDPTFDGGLSYTSHINSRKDDWSDNLQIVTIKNKKNGVINYSSSQLADIPIFIIFRALGLESDKDIISNITYNLEDNKMINLLIPSVSFSVNDNNQLIRTKEEAVDFLITKLRRYRKLSPDEEIAKVQKKMYLNKILRKDMLPHLGDDIPKKIRFLGLMVHKLLLVMLKRKSSDDRDAFDNKRIETPGILIGQLFRQNWKKILNEIGKHFKRKNQSDTKPINVINQIKPTIIEQGIKTALATGIWGMNRNKKGVAQALNRLCWLSAVSSLRRIMSPSLDASTTKVTSIRHINNIQYQFCCPVETPEGQKIGIVKSLSMMSTITNQNLSQKVIIMDILEDFNKISHPFEVNALELKEWSKIYLNGDWVYCTKHIFEIYKILLDKKQNNEISNSTSFSLDYNEKELKVYFDGGRYIRPLLKVENNNIVITKNIIDEVKLILQDKESSSGWNRLITKYKNIITYEDIESSRYIMLAEDLYNLDDNLKNKNREIVYNDSTIINRYGDYRYVNFTHIEFHRWTMLGAIACCIPFGNHNNAGRNIITFNQAKQAIGLYLSSYKDRMDISNLLYHPQMPIVTTEGTSYNEVNNLPYGENAIVAIMSYTGYNQEDSLIFNESSLDRGLFCADSMKKYHSEIKKNPSTSQDDVFMKPDRNKVTNMKHGNYDKLNEKGYLAEETIVNKGDIVIGKVSPIQPTGNNNKVYKDDSIIYTENVEGVIDRVHTNIYNNDGYEQYNMRIRMQRIPVIGDKFTNRHGQKGTVGITLPQKDMPFTEEGIIPDIIMNPTAIPSRMTVAQLIECIASKIGAVEGKFFDGTPFNNYNVRDLPGILKKLGYSPHCTDTMYCGITGRKMKAQIFIGPTYYVRLKHMTQDKVHSRSRGPRQALTRQPLEGRSRGGGLRVGEMEKDSMIAHGISQFLKERFMETSDMETFHVCDDCGLFVSKVIDKNYYHCKACNNSTRISQVNLPYACKVLFQELMSINVLPRIKTEQSKYD